MRKGMKLPRPAKMAGEKKKTRLRVGDTVVVLAGDSKGKTGVVKSLDLVKNLAVVDGINVKLKHTKAGQNESTGISYITAPVDISNVAYYDEKQKKATRLGYNLDADKKKQRFMKASGRAISSDDYVNTKKSK